MDPMTSPYAPKPGPGTHNLPELSVSELSAALKKTVEDAFGRVRVRAEISAPKVAGSGHCYLRFKDENACIDGVIWRGVMAKLSIRPEDGMDVVVTGRLTTYPARSSYQLIVESLELAGEGALLKLLEERKRKLAAEGLFAPERKRPLPFLPRVIGVVTSPTGAVIRDILHRLNDRFPMHVVVWPVLVQGDGAAEQVAQAVRGFNALPPDGRVARPDVLIVARGGGSLEDLMPFNEESVVRAVAASEIPLISAVGHETDTTLCDLAADLRAPTPTGAAEMAVPVRLDLLTQVRDDAQRLTGAMRRMVDDRAMRLEGLARGLPPLERIVEDHDQRLDDRWERLKGSARTLLDRRKAEVDHLGAKLRSPREQIAAKEAALAQAWVRHQGAWRYLHRGFEQRLTQQTARLRPDSLRTDLDRQDSDLARLGSQLDRAFARVQADLAQRLDTFGARLEAASYESALRRGYAVVWGADGSLVDSAAAAEAGAAWAVEFADGKVGVQVTGGAPAGSGPAPKAKPVPRPAVPAKPKGGRRGIRDDRQESLF